MVQLIGDVELGTGDVTYNFNSTMVQLIVSFFYARQEPVFTFQFYYGSINSRNKLRPVVSMVVFQFYYGSINSHDHRTRPRLFIQFQFYYGSINRQEQEQQDAVETNFNSTMVQLIVVLNVDGR